MDKIYIVSRIYRTHDSELAEETLHVSSSYQKAWSWLKDFGYSKEPKNKYNKKLHRLSDGMWLWQLKHTKEIMYKITRWEID